MFYFLFFIIFYHKFVLFGCQEFCEGEILHWKQLRALTAIEFTRDIHFSKLFDAKQKRNECKIFVVFRHFFFLVSGMFNQVVRLDCMTQSKGNTKPKERKKSKLLPFIFPKKNVFLCAFNKLI